MNAQKSQIYLILFLFLVVLTSAKLVTVFSPDLVSGVNATIEDSSTNSSYHIGNLTEAWVHSGSLNIISLNETKDPVLEINDTGNVYALLGYVDGTLVNLTEFDGSTQEIITVGSNSQESFFIKLPINSTLHNFSMFVANNRPPLSDTLDSFETDLENWSAFDGNAVAQRVTGWSTEGATSLNSTNSLCEVAGIQKTINATEISNVTLDVNFTHTNSGEVQIRYAGDTFYTYSSLGENINQTVDLSNYSGANALQIITSECTSGGCLCTGEDTTALIDNVRYEAKSSVLTFNSTAGTPENYSVLNSSSVSDLSNAYDGDYSTYAVVSEGFQLNETWSAVNNQYYKIKSTVPAGDFGLGETDSELNIHFFNFSGGSFEQVSGSQNLSGFYFYHITANYVNGSSDALVKINMTGETNHLYYDSDVGDLQNINITRGDIEGNLSLEVGAEDGNSEWNFEYVATGFNNESVDISVTSMQNYLDNTCDASSLICSVPLYLNSTVQSQLSFSDLQINYTYKIENFNVTNELQEISDAGKDIANLRLGSDGNGTIEISNLSYVYHIRPQIAINSPTVEESSRSNISVDVDYVYDEYENDTCLYRIEDVNNNVVKANSSYDCGTTTEFSVSFDGDYVFYAWSNDSYGAFKESSLTFTVDTTAATPSTPASSSGGSDPSPSVSKSSCDIDVSDSEVILTDGSNLAEVTLTNNDDTSLSPTYSFSDVDGYSSAKDDVVITNSIDTLLQGSSDSFGISYSGNGEVGSRTLLTLSSTNCEDIEINIVISSATLQNEIGTLFDSDKSLFENVIDILLDDLSDSLSFLKVWMLFLFVFLLLMYAALPSIKRNNKKGNGISVLLTVGLLLFIDFIVTIFLTVVIRVILG